MKLQNDFYEIIQSETASDAIRFHIKMNSQHQIYQAHFPNNPVTPGVCLVQIATELLRMTKTAVFNLCSIPKIKYRHVVRPWDEPCFEFSHISTEGDRCKVRVLVYSEECTFAQMSLIYWNKHE